MTPYLDTFHAVTESVPIKLFISVLPLSVCNHIKKWNLSAQNFAVYKLKTRRHGADTK